MHLPPSAQPPPAVKPPARAAPTSDLVMSPFISISLRPGRLADWCVAAAPDHGAVHPLLSVNSSRPLQRMGRFGQKWQNTQGEEEARKGGDTETKSQEPSRK